MKKMIILLFALLIVCSGCNGNVTRKIRHSGFSVGSKIVCKDFFSKESSKKVKYITATNIISDDGTIYELSLSSLYSNDENCRKANTDVVVKAIFDQKIIKSSDGKFYYLAAENNREAYVEVLNTDNSYSLYSLLLNGDGVVKVVTADSSIGLYYVLKTDGNVYATTVVSNNNVSNITGMQIVYNKSDYGEIIDFNYAGDSSNTYIKSNNRLFRNKVTNGAECMKYADIDCVYKLEEDTVLEEYMDKIVAFNGSILITDYNMVFNSN